MSSASLDYHEFELPYQNNIGFDAEMQHTQKRRGGCCFFGCCLGCFTFLLLIVFAIAGTWVCFFSGGALLVVSPETTIVTEPLKSDGTTVDFHRAIQAMTEPDIQADENGFRAVLLGYGQETFVTGEHRRGNVDDGGWQYEAMCKTLEIDSTTPPTFPLFRLTPDNIQRWLAEVGEGLDAVQVAAAKPHYFVPMIRRGERDLVVLSQPLAVYAFHERLSDALQTRARVQYQAKDFAGEWKDRLTSLRLFRRVTINQAWLKALGGNDDESLLAPIDEMVVALPQWTPEQLEQAIKDLESLPDWQDRQTMLKTIQFMLLDLVSAASDPSDVQEEMQKAVEVTRKVMPMIQFIAFDWNLVAKELNSEIRAYGELLERAAGKSPDEQFDLLRLRQPGETRNLPLSEERMQEFFRNHLESGGSLNFIFSSGRSKLTGAFVGRQLATWAAGEKVRLQLMEESRCQALRLAVALERFHREKGQYPETVEELGLQPMSLDMHLQYEKQGTGYRIQNKAFLLDKE